MTFLETDLVLQSRIKFECHRVTTKRKLTSLVLNLAPVTYHIITDLLSFPGCCWISSRRYFLAKSMNPFMGLLGLSGSLPVFLAGDIGGDIIEPEAVEARTEGRRLAIPCLSWRPESGRRAPGENWSDRSWLEKENKLNYGGGLTRLLFFNPLSHLENSNFLNLSQRSGVLTASG